ncbi:MAG: type II toxin-antitoxin system YafQ family toxin [Candidatus Tectomicrobia bacterium]|nr:type II toxin-antitoxin system YafQ family toxin [Candidatus Tectomicrobia bacterium]
MDTILMPVLELLINDRPLDPRHRDHPLAGEWRDYRNCHLKPDLILIYRKSGEHALQFVRLGSHSELGL